MVRAPRIHPGSCRSRKSRTTFRPVVRKEANAQMPAHGKENTASWRAAKRTGKRDRDHSAGVPGPDFPAPPLTLLAARIDDVSHPPAGSPLLHPTPTLAPVDATACPSPKTRRARLVIIGQK